MVNWRLQGLLEKYFFYDLYQSGFRAGHCTLDALACLETSVNKSLLIGSFCLVVFLDIFHVFDSVWHCGQLLKLKALSLCGPMVCFIEQFFKLRRSHSAFRGLTLTLFLSTAGFRRTRSPVRLFLQSSLITYLLISLPVFSILFMLMTVPRGSPAPPLQRLSTSCRQHLLWWMPDLIAGDSEFLHPKLRLCFSPVAVDCLIFLFFLNDIPLIFIRSAKFLSLTLDCRMSWGPHIASLHMRCHKDL